MSDEAKRVATFVETRVKEGKDSQSKPTLQWVSGDVPEFDEHGEVVPNHDDNYRSYIVSRHPSGRQPEFLEEEYCRFLHVLQDGRKAIARKLLMQPRIKEEQDMVIIDPWDEHIVDLFNDESFQPEPVHFLPEGLTLSDIKGLNQARLHHIRTSSTFKKVQRAQKSIHHLL